MAAMFFSSDQDDGKILCMAQVPAEITKTKGLKANEWCQQVQKEQCKVFEVFVLNKHNNRFKKLSMERVAVSLKVPRPVDQIHPE